MIGEASEASKPPALRRRQVAAVAAGNGIAVYDFLIYALFAAEIGRDFFPSESATASLLSSLAVFGVGFVMRPVGALLIGHLGDRRGRRAAMQLAFLLMGIAMLGLAATPTYAEIGVAAPVAVVLFRLLQGFAFGGELGPTTAFLVETAPPERRGLQVSIQYFSQDVGIVAAALTSIALAASLDPVVFDQWGWRIAFLLGAAILPIGYWLRRSIQESLPTVEETKWSPRTPRLVVCGLAILSGSAVVTYVAIYLNTYANATLGLASGFGLFSTLTLGLCGLIFSPLGGWLSDRVGRKPVMMGPWLVLLATALPGFHLVVETRSLALLVFWTALVASCAAVSITAALAAIAEALPPSNRSLGLGLTYALAVAVFGGSTQFAVAWLGAATGSAMAPAWYMTAAIAVAAIAMAAMPSPNSPRPAASGPLT